MTSATRVNSGFLVGAHGDDRAQPKAFSGTGGAGGLVDPRFEAPKQVSHGCAASGGPRAAYAE